MVSDLPDEPDAAIVERHLRGDPSARDALLDRWLPRVLRWCHGLGLGGADAEDAAHDVFLVVLTRLDQLHEPDKLGAWIFGITRHTVRRSRRRGWLRWVTDTVSSAFPASSPSPVTLVHREQVGQSVREVLERLREPHREVLVLLYLEGHSLAEVAELLNLPLNTVKTRARRARDAFRACATKRGLTPSRLTELTL